MAKFFAERFCESKSIGATSFFSSVKSAAIYFNGLGHIRLVIAGLGNFESVAMSLANVAFASLSE